MADEMEELDQAAVLLFSMGEQQAAEVLKHLSKKEVEKLIPSMNKLENLNHVDVIRSLNKFFGESNTSASIGASPQYIRDTLISAVGSNKANMLIDKAELDEKAKGLDLLNWQSTWIINEFLKDEHPQVIAFVLNYVEGEKAAEILSGIPESMHRDVLIRMSKMQSVSSVALEEISKLYEERMVETEVFRNLSLGGVQGIANILNHLDTDTENKIMGKLEKDQGDFVNQVKDRMLPFESLVQLDDRSLQTVLKEVDNDELVFALKGQDLSVQDAFFRNMSSRAADMLKDELENKGPVKLSEVQDAQKKVMAVAKGLADEGKIMLGKAGGGDAMIL
jgi:flagellar motor switch protein FliG